MKITVLGKSPAMPDAGGASSGYLVTDGDFKLVLDCGSGVFARLRQHCEPTDVGAVVISHVHADHIVDLLAFSHALNYDYKGAGVRPRLLTCPGAVQTLERIELAFGVQGQIGAAFQIEEYDPTAALAVGPLELRFQEVPHYIRAWAIDVRGQDGKRFTYGADCAPNDALPRLARATDLLFVEATEGATEHVPPGYDRGHLTAREAGALARAAGAKRVALTHFSDRLVAEDVRHAAELGFGGAVELAQSGAVFEV